jgi:hypothetical protein
LQEESLTIQRAGKKEKEGGLCERWEMGGFFFFLVRHGSLCLDKGSWEMNKTN